MWHMLVSRDSQDFKKDRSTNLWSSAERFTFTSCILIGDLIPDLRLLYSLDPDLNTVHPTVLSESGRTFCLLSLFLKASSYVRIFGLLIWMYTSNTWIFWPIPIFEKQHCYTPVVSISKTALLFHLPNWKSIFNIPLSKFITPLPCLFC